MLRKVNQTHFFRTSPSYEEMRKYNNLADHSFATACLYYRSYKESELSFNQMSDIPFDQAERWSLSTSIVDNDSSFNNTSRSIFFTNSNSSSDSDQL